MSRRKTGNKTPSIKRTERDVVAIARLVLTLISFTSNILVAIEELKVFFPRLKIRIVSDEQLPPTIEAHAHPKTWVIRIKRSIYEGLLRGATRGRWTLIHELSHVLLQHRGKPARDMQARETEKTLSGRQEREADMFTRSVLLPLDRFVDASLDRMISESGVSPKAARRRLDEFADSKDIKEALEKRGLSASLYTSEYGHRSNIERQVAAVANSIRGQLRSTPIEASALIEPVGNNLFSSSVLTAAASALLLDAYDSLAQRRKYPRRFIEAAVLALTVISICPIRPIGARVKAGAPQANLKCALEAARQIANLPSDKLMQPYFLCQEGAPAYDCHYLKEIEEAGTRLIVERDTVLGLFNFPRYENYNESNDVLWDDIHHIEYIADHLYGLSAQPA